MKSIIPLFLYFVPIFSSTLPPVTYKSYQNEIECRSKVPIQTPKTIEEIQTIVKDATKSNTHVRVVGSRHSVTDTICTDGIPLHLDHFQKVTVNSDQQTATIESGIELQDAIEALHQKGYALQQMPSFGAITVGGALALGAHGSSLRHPNTLSEYLVGATVIDGHGEIQKVNDPQELDAFRVNFGLLGVIIDVTLEVVPQFKLEIENYRVSDTFLFTNHTQILEMARQLDWFQFWWFPSSDSMVIAKGKKVPLSTKGDAKTNLVANAPPAITAISDVSLEVLALGNSFTGMSLIQKVTEDSLYKPGLLKEPVYSENGKFVNPAVGYSHRLMANRCNPCAWDFPVTDLLAVQPGEGSIAVSVTKFASVMADIKQMIKENPTAFPMYGLFVRFSPPSRGLFAIQHQQESFHVDIGYPLRLDPKNQAAYGLPVIQAITQLMFDKYNGRPHWGKNGRHFFKHDFLVKKYPAESFSKFKAVVQKYDPKGVFSNQFGDRILGVDQNIEKIPVSHCAIQSYCLCQKNTDCSSTDYCGKIMDYPVCRPVIKIL
ncbi:hypothetical protein BJ944DRAFT_248453 [Cunninghamella echinulata]|nr:hypothetical protein BJ944DRAFT_248453 [Cunninghamella echinulata]